MRPTRLPRPTPSQRLLNRLRAMGLDVPLGSTIRRTYAGHVQRAQGAWSWYVVDASGRDLFIGGYEPVTTLLRGRLVATQGFREFAVSIDTATPVEIQSSAWLYYAVEPAKVS